MGLFGLFSNKKKETLDKGLEKTKESVFGKLARAVAGKSTVDDDVLDDLEEVLITSDVGVETTVKIIRRIEERVARDKYVSTSELNRILREEIAILLSENHSDDLADWELPADHKPYVILVVGVNGVGKTTLIKCMIGLLKWKSGCSELDGTNISQLRHRELWQKIAYVPQAKGSAFSYSAIDMVTLGRSAHLGTFSQPGKEDRAAAERAMEDMGITYLHDKLCNEMSGGELQMVLIARALTIDPCMLVLDEPESNLDFKNQLIILDTIKNLSEKRGISAIVNTHYPEHALKISDKALILNRDGTSEYGAAEEVINEENMRRSFSVQVYIDNFEYEGVRHKSVVPLYLV